MLLRVTLALFVGLEVAAVLYNITIGADRAARRRQNHQQREDAAWVEKIYKHKRTRL